MCLRGVVCVLCSDPYARVRYQDKILATEVQRSTLNPEWRQWLHFVGVESGGPWGNYLLHVLDRDTYVGLLFRGHVCCSPLTLSFALPQGWLGRFARRCAC